MIYLLMMLSQVTNAESVEVAETVNFLRGTEPAEFDKLKGKVLQNLNEMIASVTNASMLDEDALKNLDQQICAAKNTFSASCANQPLEFDMKKFVNTVRRPTLFSTKRKPRNLKLCMTKPTEEENSKYKHDENVYSFMTGTQNIENKPGPEKVKSNNKFKILKLFGIKKMHFDKIGCDDFVLPEGYPLPQLINVQSSELNTIRDLFTGKAWVKVLQIVLDINET